MVDMSKNRITVLGSANYDYFLLVNKLPEIGETMSSNGLVNACGGKGANQAVGIARQGYPVSFVGQLGKDSSGEILLKSLKDNKVDVENIKFHSTEPTGQAYIFSYPDKNNSIILVGGANMNWEGNNLDHLKESLEKSQILLLQREIPEKINIEGARLAKELGLLVIIDAGGEDKPISKELLKYVDIISPNETELYRIIGKHTNIESEADILESIQELRKYAENEKLRLLLKLGSKGSIYVDENNKFYKRGALKIEDMPIVDTTGAGDCFTASFSSQILIGKSIDEAMRYSTYAAYSCITKFGATPSLPTSDDIKIIESKVNSII